MRVGSNSSCELTPRLSPRQPQYILRSLSCIALALLSLVGCNGASSPNAPHATASQAGHAAADAAHGGSDAEAAGAGHAAVEKPVAGTAGTSKAGSDAAAGRGEQAGAAAPDAAPDNPPADSTDSSAADSGGDPLLFGMPPGSDSKRPGFCARTNADRDVVHDLFCADKAPAIRSLNDLQVALKLAPSASNDSETVYPMLLGHSTALFGRLVSPLNPRAIVLNDDVVIAFQRGTQHVELISSVLDPSKSHFYLLSFQQACNAQSAGCTPGDLYTPRLESDWTSASIYDDEELKNTPADCRQCHQRGLAAPMLLMRELERPWTHFFDSPLTDAATPQPGVRGSDLLQDFLDARGDELYAGINAMMFDPSFAFILEQRAGGRQPLIFEALTIERERYPRQADGSFPESPMPSPTWNNAYEAFKRGEQLALPYFEPRVTDAAKLAKLTAAYQSFRKSELAAEKLPDMADIFSDDRHTRAQIGLQTEPDATPAQALIQACGGCHNDVLDQNVTRAKFNIDLSRMSRQELDLAIKRIGLSRTAEGAMPPSNARQLDSDVRQHLVEFLRSGVEPGSVDPMLQRAANLGMKGSRVGQ